MQFQLFLYTRSRLRKIGAEWNEQTAKKMASPFYISIARETPMGKFNPQRTHSITGNGRDRRRTRQSHGVYTRIIS